MAAPELTLDAMTDDDRRRLLALLAAGWAQSHYKDNLAMVAFLKRLPILRTTAGTFVAAADFTEDTPLHCCPPCVFQPPPHTPLLEWREDLVGLYGAVGVVQLGDTEVLAAFVLPAFSRMSATGQAACMAYLQRNWPQLKTSEPLLAVLRNTPFVESSAGVGVRRYDSRLVGSS